MRKFIIIVGAMALCQAVSHARIIAPSEAMQLAASYTSRTATAAKHTKAVAIHSQPTLIHTERQGGEDLFYVFNRPGQGYIIIAADDRCESVLAYSDTEELTDYATVPANMKAWLGEYARQISAARASSTAHAPRRNARRQVSPMLTTRWAQTAPYNGDCPDVLMAGSATATTKAVAGCVATAVSQLMNFYRHPAAPKGDLHYVWTHTDRNDVETVTRHFTGHTYDWDNMLPDFTVAGVTDAQKADIATLVADAAYSVEMQFGESESASATMLVPFAMNTYFGYDASAIYEERDFHDNGEWENIISDELEAGRPVIYCGTTSARDSHTWVIDGTDGQGMYHINWGWGGFQDGYFLLTGTDILAPETGGTGGASVKSSYDIGQAAILGMKPDAGGQPRVDFVSMKGESLSETVVERPLSITPDQDQPDLWLSLNGEFLNHSNRGTDRYCEFALRLTNVATGETAIIQMPTEAPILMQSLMALSSIMVLKTELQFMPSGDYDVEALFRDYTVKIVGGQMQYVGDQQWKPFRHLHGAPTTQRLKLTGSAPDLYLTTAVENTVPTIDHMVFKATVHANVDIDTYLIPLLFEATGFDPEGRPTSWSAYPARQQLPSTHVQMSAGETRTYWFGEWQYNVQPNELPQLLLMRFALSQDPNGYWDGNYMLAPDYLNQSLFAPTPATAITTITAADSRQAGTAYTIGGQRVAVGQTSTLNPGLYIIGGKKVIVK